MPDSLSAQPIVRFGAETDLALEYLELLDSIIPRLHGLAHSTHSSKWEWVLRRPEWGFSYEQAAIVSKAMIQDIVVEDLKVCASLSHPEIETNRSTSVKPPQSRAIFPVRKLSSILV